MLRCVGTALNRRAAFTELARHTPRQSLRRRRHCTIEVGQPVPAWRAVHATLFTARSGHGPMPESRPPASFDGTAEPETDSTQRSIGNTQFAIGNTQFGRTIACQRDRPYRLSIRRHESTSSITRHEGGNDFVVARVAISAIGAASRNGLVIMCAALRLGRVGLHAGGRAPHRSSGSGS